MPMYDFFKNLFGIPNSDNDQNSQRFGENEENNNRREQYWGRNSDNFENLWRGAQGAGEEPSDPRFNVYADPLEIHRYFEHQMSEMLKSFHGMFSQDSAPFFGFGFSDRSLMPPSGDLPQEPPSRNLRDQFLKPGYGISKGDSSISGPKSDSDVDGKVNLDDLDGLLRDKPQKRNLVPFQDRQQIAPQIKMFGQSVSSKTVRRPDGALETHHTIRDTAGNEETRITRQIGDKKYTVTVRTDKNGRQEKTEDMVNISEKELSQFTDNWRKESSQNKQTEDLNRWFPFDKFFK